MSLLAFLSGAGSALWRERRWTVERHQALQAARVAALLQYARDTTPLWTERLAGLEGRAEDLTRVRPITKEELMARFTDGIAFRALQLEEIEAFTRDPSGAGRPYRDRYIVATTSGTTGRVGYFVIDADAWARENGALFARILRHRLIPREIVRFTWGRRYKMAMTIATEGHFITRLVSGFRPALTNLFLKMQTYSVMEVLDRTVEGLNRYRPHYLHGYPTFLEALAHAQLQGALKIAPEFISLGSEPVSAIARATLARAFPTAEISETYGATECLVIANQCRLGRLHQNADLAVLEPVDRDGRPVPPGVASDKVYVTNLANRAQPLIRYELPDSVTVDPEPCPCGAGLPVIRVEGRSDDTFFLADPSGRYHAYPPVPFETLFLGVRGLAQYQLVHEVQNHLRIRFVAEAGADAGHIARDLEARFRNHLGKNRLDDCVRLALEPVGRLEREARGHKLRQVYSKVPRPADSS